MKNIYFTLILLLSYFFNYCQCGSPTYDNGGVSGNYLPNSNYTYVFCPTNPGDVVTITFTAFDTEAEHDGLYVYSGYDLSSPQISSGNLAANVPGGKPGAFWGNTIPGPFTSTSPDGCLTIQFISDSNNELPGYIANVTCGLVYNSGFRLNAFYDSNSNNIQDAGEYNFPCGNFTYQQNGGTIFHYYDPTGYTEINEDNSSNFYNFGFDLDPVYSSMYNSVMNYNNINIGSGLGLTPINFPITSITNYNDLGINIIPVSSARAGFDYVNRLQYRNYGNQTIASGNITFTNDSAVSIVSTSETVSSTSNGFTFSFNNLLPFETRYIDVIMSVPAIPTVFLGQIINNNATISTNLSEISLANNNSVVSQLIVGSYDPNDKTESHGEEILISNFTQEDYLFYTIRFENTGTAPAETVLVTDLLDSKIDETTIKMISSSHNYILERSGNNLNWKFNNIQLPPSVANTTTGKGFITFKAKLKPGFTVGTLIPNRANIYFDANPAIETNTFVSEFVSNLKTSSYDQIKVMIFPNPVSNSITVFSNSKLISISIFDIQGRQIQEIKTDNLETSIDINKLQQGNYFLKIITEAGIVTEKLLKQ